MIRMFFVAIALSIAVPRPAYAYLDPGTASIMLQAVVGAFAVVGIYFRKYIYRFFSLFKRAEKAPSTSGKPPKPTK